MSPSDHTVLQEDLRALELVGLGDLSDGLEGGEVGTLEVDAVGGILVFDFDHLDLPILAFEGKEFFGGGFPDALLFHS